MKELKISKNYIKRTFDKSLKQQEFEAFYQPKYNSYSEKMVSAEALVRWRKNDQWISPNEFIGYLEENKNITKLDLYIVEEVCKKQRALLNKGIDPVPVAVNFSVVNLYNEGFLENLMEILARYHINSELIELEFTEGIFIEGIDKILPTLYLLKEKGFSIALDDFGSGYSSLALLKELPIDVLKLDRRFLNYSCIPNEKARKKGEYIVKKVIELCKDLEITIIAEGIETAEQLDFLRKCKCDIIQGYFFSKPLTAEEFDRCYSMCN